MLLLALGVLFPCTHSATNITNVSSTIEVASKNPVDKSAKCKRINSGKRWIDEQGLTGKASQAMQKLIKTCAGWQIVIVEQGAIVCPPIFLDKPQNHLNLLEPDAFSPPHPPS